MSWRSLRCPRKIHWLFKVFIEELTHLAGRSGIERVAEDSLKELLPLDHFILESHGEFGAGCLVHTNALFHGLQNGPEHFLLEAVHLNEAHFGEILCFNFPAFPCANAIEAIIYEQ